MHYTWQSQDMHRRYYGIWGFVGNIILSCDALKCKLTHTTGFDPEKQLMWPQSSGVHVESTWQQLGAHAQRELGSPKVTYIFVDLRTSSLLFPLKSCTALPFIC